MFNADMLPDPSGYCQAVNAESSCLNFIFYRPEK